MSVLIITHSNDNECVARVTEAIARKGGHTIRFDTDRYPTEVLLTAYYGPSSSPGDERLTLTNEAGEFDLREVTAVWHRRISFGANLPSGLDGSKQYQRVPHNVIFNLRYCRGDSLGNVVLRM